MALQSSGQIDISDIQAELGSTSGSLRTLSAAAGKTSPDAMSEFYGYSAGIEPTENFGTLNYYGNSSTNLVRGSKFKGWAPHFSGLSSGTTSQPRIYSDNTNLRNFFTSKRTCSVSFWFIANAKSTSSNIYGLFSDYGGTSFNIWSYLDTNGYLNVYTRYGSGNNLLYTGSTNYKDGVWHHVVVTLNSGTLERKIYFDGSLINTGTTPSTSYSASATVYPSIGGMILGTGAQTYHPLYGQMDRVRIYSNVLSSTSVTALYNESSTNQTTNITSDTIYSALMFLNREAYDSSLAFNWTEAGNLEWSSGSNFTPDLIIIKNRSISNSWHWQNRVSGYGNWLSTANTNGLNTATNINSVSSTGFSLASNSGTNNTNYRYVSYVWKAGGTASSNTDGSVTSQVSANQSAGFSIVKFTSSGGSGTVGHGLGGTPDIVLMKRTSTTSDWYLFTTAIDGTMDLLRLNTQAAQASNTSQSFTSTTFKDWASSGDFIAFCWRSISGYQKVGTYDGLGTSQVTVTGVGFKPRFIMIKNVDTNSNWNVYDVSRSTVTDRANLILYPNLANAEPTVTSYYFDMNSNGFVVSATNHEQHNKAGRTYLYLAIA